MTLVWVTGNSGTGKSTVQRTLVGRGKTAIEAEWAGYSGWVARASGRPLLDPPYPVPPGWLDRYAWRISRARVDALAQTARQDVVYLCGSAENEHEVRDLFDIVVCLVVDEETLRQRLQDRTTNAFGQNPEELAVVLAENQNATAMYQQLGATIVDGIKSVVEVADQIVTRAESQTFSVTLRGMSQCRPGQGGDLGAHHLRGCGREALP